MPIRSHPIQYQLLIIKRWVKVTWSPDLILLVLTTFWRSFPSSFFFSHLPYSISLRLSYFHSSLSNFSSRFPLISNDANPSSDHLETFLTVPSGRRLLTARGEQISDHKNSWIDSNSGRDVDVSRRSCRIPLFRRFTQWLSISEKSSEYSLYLLLLFLLFISSSLYIQRMNNTFLTTQWKTRKSHLFLFGFVFFLVTRIASFFFFLFPFLHN